MTDDTRTPEALTSDAAKLRTLATWFDKFDDWREATNKIAPGIAEYREVQSDLRRIADALATPEPTLDVETAEGWRWECAGCDRPVPPMGMCETCGVFGVMRLREAKP